MADTGQTPSCHENKINSNPQVLKVLETLKKASHELQAHPHVPRLRFLSRYKDDSDHEGEDNKIGEGRSIRERKFLESHPFASSVARLAVQLELGEGLRQRERREFKQDILDRVRKASDTDTKAATIVVEVLWGSSP